MSSKKNIDRLFQEKFKDFEVVPNNTVWNRITANLASTKKKKRRKVIPLWWQIGGVAAIIAIALTIGISVFNANDNTNLPVVDTKSTIKENQEGNNTSNNKANQINGEHADKIKFVDYSVDTKPLKKEQKNNTSPSNTSTDQLHKSKTSNPSIANHHKGKEKQKTINNNLGTKTTNKNAIVLNTSSNASSNSKNATKTSEDELKSTIEKMMKEENSVVVNTTDTESINANEIKNEDIKTLNTILDNKQSITDAVAENTKTTNEKEDKQNKWSITPNVAPVYFGSLGKGSSLDKQFNENAKSSTISMSYGVAGTYNISDKIKIRGGINRVSFNHTTSDVFSFTGAKTSARSMDAQFGNITFKDGMQTVSFISEKTLNRASTPEVFNTKITSDIDQRFGFIEVPLELEYSLLDKKFGVNIIGGFSTLFLNQNEIHTTIDGVFTLVGKANNINAMSFSANFGLGLDYKLFEQWTINLEPQFKYQINTFNNTSGNFKPFFIGVYTGLNFKF